MREDQKRITLMKEKVNVPAPDGIMVAGGYKDGF
jgi:hypothetical protein